MNVMVHRWLRRIVLAVALCAGAGSAHAADFDVGLSAYAAGDYATALREWSALAEAGDVEAQYSMAELYERGQGVAQSDADAAGWYARAAALGHVRSQVKLAAMYAAGRGVAADPAKAVELWTTAADQDSGTAQVRLAEAYRTGQGVPKDLVAAQAWYQKAADGGDGNARVELFEVNQEIEREAAAAAEMSLESAPLAETEPAATADAAEDAHGEIATEEAEHGTEAALGAAEGLPPEGEAHGAETEHVAETHATEEHVDDAHAEEAHPAVAHAEEEHAEGLEPVTEAETASPDAAPPEDDPYAPLIAAKQAVVLSLAPAPEPEPVPEPMEATEPPAEEQHGAAEGDEHGAVVEPAAHASQVAVADTHEAAPVQVAEAPTFRREHEAPAAVVMAQAMVMAEPARAEDLETEPTFRVWLASFDDAGTAEAGWQTLVARNSDLLASLTAEVIPPDLARGEDLFRLHAGPFATATAAQDVCRELGQRSVDCVAVAP